MSSLVAVDSVLSLSLWASAHISISSVLIQSLTSYSTLRGGGDLFLSLCEFFLHWDDCCCSKCCRLPLNLWYLFRGLIPNTHSCSHKLNLFRLILHSIHSMQHLLYYPWAPWCCTEPHGNISTYTFASWCTNRTTDTHDRQLKGNAGDFHSFSIYFVLTV